MIYTAIYVTAIIGMALYNIYLLNKNSDLSQQLKEYYDLTLAMAQELKELGSPNVEITEIDTKEY